MMIFSSFSSKYKLKGPGRVLHPATMDLGREIVDDE